MRKRGEGEGRGKEGREKEGRGKEGREEEGRGKEGKISCVSLHQVFLIDTECFYNTN